MSYFCPEIINIVSQSAHCLSATDRSSALKNLESLLLKKSSVDLKTATKLSYVRNQIGFM